MNKKNKQIILNEYKSLFKIKEGDGFEFGDSDNNGNVAINQKTFDAIDNFVTSVGENIKKQKHVIITHKKDGEEEKIDVLKRGQRKINGIRHEVLTAQSFVGVIVTNDGTSIEILPKINTGKNEQQVRKTFLRMLRSLKQSPDNKVFNQANLSNSKIHLFEIFIEMFCVELEELVRKGLKSDYVNQTQNQNFLKGKLNLKKHLQHNFVHKERFFVSFDEYKMDIPENRIIKTTVDFLFKISKDNKNKKRLREMKFVFDSVPVSHNIKKDFMQLKDNRILHDYKLILNWCRIFLAKESFTSFYGKNIAFALLFDMNKVFEDYVAQCLVQNEEYYNVKTQKSGKHLVVYPNKKFSLRPDLFFEFESGEGKQKVIADTKWKLIDLQDNAKNWNISQSDIYQMFAYGKKFKRNKVQLIYPKNESFTQSESIEKMFFEYDTENKFSLEVLCFDCEKGEVV
jgi:5-methylcytosine-specific restriction enzyme subunit McrC